MIFYLNSYFFNKYINKKLVCRNSYCYNDIKKPYRFFCSKECYENFNNYYCNFHYWHDIKTKIILRDNYTCQICGWQHPHNLSSNYKKKDGLEVDHIVPRAVMLKEYLEKMYLLRKYKKYHFKIKKRFYEIVNSEYNLRTLCSNCHTNVRSEQFKKYNYFEKTTSKERQNINNHYKKLVRLLKDEMVNINSYYLDRDFYNNIIDETIKSIFIWHDEYYGFILFMQRLENGKKELIPLLENWYQTKLS